MALLVGELKSVLDLDTTKYDQGLDRSHARFSKFVKGAAIASAAAAVAAGAGLLNLAKGAAQDEKAQSILAKTLKNTAKATDAQVASIEDYISKTGAATGVTDDEMRPALANLVRATHDVGKAQSLMGLAMDVSAGTGKDLGAVTMALAKAQNGNVGALGRLGIATKDAHGKTKSFNQIQKDLAATFKGQSQAAADTTAGKFARLKLIMSEAGESIGYKVLPVLLTLSTFLLDKVVPAVSGAVSTFVGLGKKIVNAIGPINLSGVSTGIFNETKAWAGSIISGLKSGVATGDWKPLGTALGAGIITAIQNLSTKGGEILDAIGRLVDKVDWPALGKKVSGAISGMFTGIDWKAVGSSLGDAVVNIVEKSSDLGVKLGTAFKGLIQGMDWKKIGNDSTNSIIAFVEGIDWIRVGKVLGIAVFKSLKISRAVYDSVISSAADLVTGMFTAIIAAMSRWKVNVNAYVRQVGGELIAGLWAGMKNAMKGVGGFLKSVVVDPIVNWVKSLFGVHSPSTVFAAIGVQLIAGLKVGIVSGAAGIGRWMYSTVISPVVAPFGKAGTWLVQHGRNAVAGFKNGVSTIANGIGRWMYDHVVRPVVAPFNNSPGTWLSRQGANVIAGFGAGMRSVWGRVTAWVSGIATWIKDHKGPVSLDGRLLIPAGQAIMSGFLSGLKSGAGPAWAFVKSVGGKTVDMLRSIFGGPFMGGGGPAPTNLSGMQALVRTIAAQRGWGSGAQWDALYQLIQHESGFNPNAQNPTSSAYGLFQFLNSTWGSVGASKTSDPWGQTAAGLRYIASAYGSPLAAWSAWQSRSPHWYAKGTPWVPDDQLAFVHRGEAIIPVDVNRAARDARRAAAGDRPVVLHDSTIGKLAAAMIRAAREIPVVVDPRGLDEAMSRHALLGGY